MKETISSFKRTIFVLFMVFAPAACRFGNNYMVEVSCKSSRLTLKYEFEKPFKGVIYTDRHPFDPACSFRASPLPNVKQVTLEIPFCSCGTNIQFVPNGRSIVSNKIRIRQHNILKTSDDFSETISCPILGLDESCNRSLTSKNKEVTKPTTKLQLEIGRKALGIKLASKLRLSDKSLLVFRVPNDGQIKDIHVKTCVIHEKTIVDNDSFFYQITHPSGCLNISTDVISPFTVLNHTESGELLAYAEIKPFKHIGSDYGMYISCGAELCKKTCKRKCSRKRSRSDTLNAVATHMISKRSISKRSIESGSAMPTRKQSDVRNRLLRSTIKALSEKLMKEVNKTRNGTVFAKRALDIAQINTTTIPIETPSSGIQAYNFSSFDAEFTTTSPKDYEIGLSNMFHDADDIELFRRDYESFIDALPNSAFSNDTRTESDDENQVPRSDPKVLSEKLAKKLKKLKQSGVFKKRDEKTAQKNVSINSETRAYSEISTTFANSNIESNNYYKDYELALNTLKEVLDETRYNTSNFEVPDLSTLPTSSSIEDKDITLNTSFEVPESKLVEKDLETEKKSILKDSMNFIETPTEIDLDYKNSLNRSCVPRSTILAVSVVLGFTIFTLLMICCGMVLYIRKEKKRHLIDHFLLYSFY